MPLRYPAKLTIKLPKAAYYRAAHRYRPFVLLTLLLLALVGPADSAAATIYVTSTADAGAGSLREAVATAADGDLIRFGAATDGQLIQLSQAIQINRAITVEGNGSDRTRISGGGATQLFRIAVDADNDGEIKLLKLGLVDGYAAGRGGAIEIVSGRVVGTFLQIENCRVAGTSPGSGGGAIYVGDSLYLSRSTLSGNRAEGPQGSGGAILSGPGANLKLYFVDLRHNYAGRAGGGLYAFEDLSNYSYFREVTIDSNATDGNGGGLGAEGGGITDFYIGRIAHNVAAGEGGGVYAADGQFELRAFRVQHNTAGVNGGGIASRGGYLRIEPGNLIADNAVSAADGFGGGLFVAGGLGLRMNDAAIQRNRAAGGGGGVAYLPDTHSQFWAIHTEITDNTAEGSGGNGGGVYVAGTDTMSFIRCALSRNRATGSGGGLWAHTATVALSQTDVSGNLATGDGADAGGGGMYCEAGHLDIQRARFAANRASGAAGSGGALLLRAASIKIRHEGWFRDNQSTARGGAICLLDRGLVIHKQALTNNQTTGTEGRGGAVYCRGGNLWVTTSVLRANAAARQGGALYLGPGGSLFVNKSDLLDNQLHGTAAVAGGAIYHGGDELEVLNSTISNSSALGDRLSSGGALADGSPSGGLLRLSTVSGNTTTGTGGGIDNRGAFQIEHATVALNQALRGGALVHSEGTITTLGTAYSDNRAATGWVDFSASPGTIQSGGYNLIGDDQDFIALRHTTDLTGTSARLLPLADNGGSTLTHRLADGSPLVNRGLPSKHLSDQIGQKPAGGRREIGALEMVSANFFADPDGDGFGDPGSSVAAAAAPAGYVIDNSDNCPHENNPAQIDSDGDGIGDACDDDR